VELLGKAWLCRDLPLMRRLTLSTHERTIYAWLLRHPPPLTRKVELVDLSDVKFEVSLLRTVGSVADVRLRITGLNAAKEQRPIDFSQRWEERDNIWLFTPPVR